MQRDALDVWLADTGAIDRTLGSPQLQVVERQDQVEVQMTVQGLGDDSSVTRLVDCETVEAVRVDGNGLELCASMVLDFPFGAGLAGRGFCCCRL